MREVFTASTVRALAAAVAGNAEALSPIVAVNHAPPDSVVVRAATGVVHQPVRSSAATYNIPAVLRLTGSLDVDALRRSVIDVLARHGCSARRSRPTTACPSSRSATSPSSTPAASGRSSTPTTRCSPGNNRFDVTTAWWPLRVTLRDACLAARLLREQGKEASPWLLRGGGACCRRLPSGSGGGRYHLLDP